MLIHNDRRFPHLDGMFTPAALIEFHVESDKVLAAITMNFAR